MSIEKISALLAKAEATDNEHEAEAYMKKAQMLATSYSIDLAHARSHVAKASKREQPENRRVKVAEVAGRDINKHMVELISKIGWNNDLRMTVSHGNCSVNLFGFPSDMEVAEAMFASLAHQMVEAANRYIKGGEWQGQRYWAERTNDSWGGGWKTYTARSARNAFYDGWLSRIGQRLREARQEAIKEYKVAPSHAPIENPVAAPVEASETSAELVLKGKEIEVTEYYKKHSNARGTWKGSSAARGGSAGSAGTAAANSARIGSQRGIGGKSGAIG